MLEKWKRVIASISGGDKKKDFSQKLLAGVWIFAVSFKKNIWQQLLKFKISFYAVISLLGIYSREIKSQVQKDMQIRTQYSSILNWQKNLGNKHVPVVNLMSGTFKPTLLNSTLKLGLCKVTQLPLKKDTAGKLEAWEKKTGFASCWLLICFLCLSISLGTILNRGSSSSFLQPLLSLCSFSHTCRSRF